MKICDKIFNGCKFYLKKGFDVMLKGFLIYYLLSALTGNPLLALIIIIVAYVLLDKVYLGFLPDFSAPFRRNSRIKNLLSLIKVNPANADAAQELGILYFEKGKYHKSLEYLKMAHEKVKNSARLYLYLGMSYVELGQLEPGKEALDNAVELDRKTGHGLPYIYLLRYELTRSEINPGALSRLETEFEKFANTENFFRMGRVYKHAGRNQEASEMFTQALQDYAYVPKTLRRIHRKWAMLSWLNKAILLPGKK